MNHCRNVISALLLLLVLAGCTPKVPDDGIRLYCDGTAVDLHWWNRPINCPPYEARCYEKIDKFQLCIDPDVQIAETGFDEEDWVNDTESLDYIRGQCTVECVNQNSTYSALASLRPKCWGGVWTILNHEKLPTPDPGYAIKDPEHLSCRSAENSNLRPKPNASSLSVIAPGTTPRWPRTSEYIEVICDNLRDCSKEFAAPILGYLFYEDVNGDWGNDMGRADYVAIAGVDAAMRLTLSIDNPSSDTSSETNTARGRIEYSAPNCGEMECPFYVANMTLDNESDIWTLWSEFEIAYVHVANIHARLRRPVLGVWNTSTNEIYIGEGMMELYVEASVAVGAGEPEFTESFVVNNADLFGEIGENGSVSFMSLAASDGGVLALEADLDYDVLTDRPPAADIGLPSVVAAPTNAGLPINSIVDASSDPDGDITTRLWIVDGHQQGYDHVIPLGAHELILEVEDERGAFDTDLQIVEVAYP